MNVCHLRDESVRDCAAYVRSFIRICERRIAEYVDEALASGLFWPGPLIQLNPSVEPGCWVDDLARDGLLHPECGRVFRAKPQPEDSGSPMRLHRHQVEALAAARTGQGYVLTTGTGLGTRLAYMLATVDHAPRRGAGQCSQSPPDLSTHDAERSRK